MVVTCGMHESDVHKPALIVNKFLQLSLSLETMGGCGHVETSLLVIYGNIKPKFGSKGHWP